MKPRGKILFVINLPAREMNTIERIVSALEEIDQKIQTDIVEYLSPTFLTDVLEANPDILVTYPFTAIGLSQRFYIIKFLLNCCVVTFPAEGLLSSTSSSYISRMTGFDRYGKVLVDHAIFWGTKSAKFIGDELLNTGRISSRNRLHPMGAPLYEAYFELKKAVHQMLPPDIAAKIGRYDRKNICLFLTGFSLAYYTNKDLIVAGDLIDSYDQNKAKKHLDEMKLSRSRVKVYQSLWMEAMESVADMHHDFLFIVKIHPHEMKIHRNKNIHPYKVLEGYSNILLVDGDTYISEILSYCGILFHYGSTAMLEAYLSKVPSCYLYVDELRGEGPDAHALHQLSTLSSDIRNVSSIVAEHKKSPIEFTQQPEVETYLKDSLNMVPSQPYHPSKRIARFLLSLVREQSQLISPDDQYLINAVQQTGKMVIAELMNRGIGKIREQEYQVGLTVFLNRAMILARIGRFKVNKLQYLRALCLFKMGSTADAIDAVREELRISPNDEESMKLLRELETASGEIRIRSGTQYPEQFTRLVPEIFAVETILGCDLKCPECAVGGNFINRKKGWMRFDQFKIIADKIRPYCKLLYLHIWGEPMLNKDIFKMIEYASAFTSTNISTNGNALTEENAEKLITSGVTDIIVSIDGVSQEVYEKYRVGGNVKKATESLKMIQHFNLKYGNKVHIMPQFIVMKHNQHEMNEFQKLCESLELLPSFKSPYIRNPRSQFSVSDDPRFIRPHFSDIKSLRGAMTECESVRNVFNVLLNGSVVLCCHDYGKFTDFGNIFERDVMEIWNSDKFRNARWNVMSGNAPKFCIDKCMSYYLDDEISNYKSSQQEDCKAVLEQKDSKNNKMTPKDSITYNLGRRQKFRINLGGLQNDLSSARDKFEREAFLEGFDIYEQLVASYPDQAVNILAEVYDCYKRFPYKDRYNLYQARLFNFGIKPSDKVLDIGSGHIPFPLATHLADITLENHKYGRDGVPFKHVQGKPVFECSVEDTPFEDKEFDFVYCSHVLEHAQNPDKACNELMRIAKRGYIETPARAKDIFLNSAKVSNHKMWVEVVNGLLIFTEYTAEEIEGMQCGILMDMHCAPKTEREKAFSALIYLKPHFVNTMFIWENEFRYEVRRLPTNANKQKLDETANKSSESSKQIDRKDIAQELRGFSPKKTKKLSFLQIHTFYSQYLSKYYEANPHLSSIPFKEQMDVLVRDGFSAVHMIAPYMDTLEDYEAQLIIANNPYSQQKWLIENNVVLPNNKNWISDILRRQIDQLKPDVLYLSDPITCDSQFVRSLSWKPSLIIGWRAANIPEGTDWSEFDIMLSSLSSLRQTALMLGAKSAEHFFPGFPGSINEMITDVQPSFDVVFSGQWTLSQHARRNHYLTEIAKAASQPERGFSCAYYLSGQVDKIPSEVAKFNLGGRFGISMYRAIRSGKIAIDARGILEIRDSEHQKTTDLAANETANMRIFEVTGCGVFLLTEYFDGLKQYFELGKEIETFRDDKELVEKIHYYLEHPNEREAIARRGQERCLSEYSMENRAKAFDKIIQKHLSSKTNSIHTPNADTIIRQAVDKLNTNDNSEALLLLDRAIAENVAIPSLNYGKAVAHARLGQMDEAIAALRSLLSFEPEHEKGKPLLNEIIKVSISDLMERAGNLLDAHANNDAFALLNKAKSLKKPTQGLDYLRAIYFSRLSQPNSVREALQEELRYFPNSEKAKELLNQIVTQYPQRVCSKIDDTEFQELFQVIHPYTMVGEERLFSLFSLAKRVCREDIPGNFVECGVAAGGSSALLAYIIKRYSKRVRWHFAFDSFEGMPSPGEQDRDVAGMAADLSGWGTGTCAAPEASLKEICDKLGVSQIVKPVKGYFETVLPKMRDKIGMIAFLHMDGDWYESTKTILHNLYDRVVNDGLIQVDDYGYWQGCKKAIHEFESSRSVQFEVKQIDGTGIWFRKPARFPVNESISPLIVSAFHKIDKVPPLVPSQMSTNERFQLYYAIRELLPSKYTSLRFVEVGSWAGGSLLLIHRAMKEKTADVKGFAIEPGGQPQFYEVLKYLKDEVVHLRMLSHQAAPQLKRLFQKDHSLPQIIFLDGSHKYDDVKQDIVDFFPLLAKGGIMIFHDYLPQLSDKNREAILFHHSGNEPGIRRACEELMEKTYDCEVINLPLLYPTDPTQTQSHFPIIPGIFSTIRAYRKL